MAHAQPRKQGQKRSRANGGGTAATPPRGAAGFGLLLATEAAEKRRRRRRRQRGSDSESSESLDGQLVARRWRIVERIGSGSFADCYLGEDQSVKRTDGTYRPVCLKVEDTRRCNGPTKLKAEWDFLRMLRKERHTPVPLQFFPWETAGRTVLVQELLGPSLEDLFQRCGKRLTPTTVSLVAPQVLECIEHCHRHGILHRDIKPHNFLMGRGGESHRVFLIDFGLSRSFRDKSTGQHIPFRSDRPLIGTARYVSLAVHRGHEQGRRDDLESIAHMFYYFLWGQLPWQGLPKQPDKQRRNQKIFEAKEKAGITKLCEGHPRALREFLEYSRKLGFDKEPDYPALKRLLTDFRREQAGGERYQLLDWRVNHVYDQVQAADEGDDDGVESLEESEEESGKGEEEEEEDEEDDEDEEDEEKGR